MGWCSATSIFDNVIREVIEIAPQDILEKVAFALGKELQDGDWDCEEESEYIDDERLKRVWHNLNVAHGANRG